MHAKDEDFKEILKKCSKHAYGLFHLENGFSSRALDFADQEVDSGSF